MEGIEQTRTGIRVRPPGWAGHRYRDGRRLAVPVRWDQKYVSACVRDDILGDVSEQQPAETAVSTGPQQYRRRFVGRLRGENLLGRIPTTDVGSCLDTLLLELCGERRKPLHALVVRRIGVLRRPDVDEHRFPCRATEV